MERDRAALEADPDATEMVRRQWMTRIVDLLEEHPDAVRDLKELLRTIDDGRSATNSTTTHMSVKQRADRGGTNVAAAGNVTVNRWAGQ